MEEKNINISRSQSQLNISTRKPQESHEKYRFDMEILYEPISLLRFCRSDIDIILFGLMKEVLFKDKFVFFSMTVNDREVSIFVDQKISNILLEYYKDKIIGCTDNDYNAIKIYDSCDGVDHVGIVSTISTMFAELKIPILYINSFNNNYILIKNTYLEQAKKCISLCGGSYDK